MARCPWQPLPPSAFHETIQCAPHRTAAAPLLPFLRAAGAASPGEVVPLLAAAAQRYGTVTPAVTDVCLRRVRQLSPSDLVATARPEALAIGLGPSEIVHILWVFPPSCTCTRGVFVGFADSS